MPFHGVQFGFGCFDGTGQERILPGGVATAVGEVTNIDEFGDVMRIDSVRAILTHTDGSQTEFAQMFPGPSTVIPTESKQVIVLVTAKPEDTGTLVVKVLTDGVDVTSGRPFSGTWQIPLTVIG